MVWSYSAAAGYSPECCGSGSTPATLCSAGALWLAGVCLAPAEPGVAVGGEAGAGGCFAALGPLCWGGWMADICWLRRWRSTANQIARPDKITKPSAIMLIAIRTVVSISISLSRRTPSGAGARVSGEAAAVGAFPWHQMTCILSGQLITRIITQSNQSLRYVQKVLGEQYATMGNKGPYSPLWLPSFPGQQGRSHLLRGRKIGENIYDEEALSNTTVTHWWTDRIFRNGWRIVFSSLLCCQPDYTTGAAYCERCLFLHPI